MSDDIGTELKGLLQVGRRKRVVHDEKGSAFMGNRRERLNVGDVQQRVGGSLDPDQARVGTHRGPDLVDVRQLGRRVLQAPATEYLGEEPVGPAVRVVGDHDMVAGRAERA